MEGAHLQASSGPPHRSPASDALSMDWHVQVTFCTSVWVTHCKLRGYEGATLVVSWVRLQEYCKHDLQFLVILRALQFLQNQNELYYSTAAMTGLPSLVSIFSSLANDLWLIWQIFYMSRIWAEKINSLC